MTPVDTSESASPLDPPAAVDDAASTTQDDAVVVDVLTNDTDPYGAPVLDALDATGTVGTLTLVEGGVRWDPAGAFDRLDAGETAADAFRYVIRGDGGTASAGVTITVTGLEDAPVAVDDAYSVARGGTLAVDPLDGVLANDHDPDEEPLTVSLVQGPAHAASGNVNANGSFNYVHDGSEGTADAFVYAISDGSTSVIATARITITP